MKQLEARKFRSPKVKFMMAQYPDVFIMTFSIHTCIPNFVLLSQSAQLLLIFCYAAPLSCGYAEGESVVYMHVCIMQIIMVCMWIL